MAIKILSNGKEKEYFAKCPKCSSELLYNYEDVTISKVDVGFYETYKHELKCPVCDEAFQVMLTTTNEYKAAAEKGGFMPYYMIPSIATTNCFQNNKDTVDVQVNIETED